MKKLLISLSFLLLPVTFHAMDLDSLAGQLRELQGQLNSLQQKLQPSTAITPIEPVQPEGPLVLRGEIPVLVSGILMNKPATNQLLALLRKSYPEATFTDYNLWEYSGDKKDVGIVVVWHSTRLAGDLPKRVKEFFKTPIVILLKPIAAPKEQYLNVEQRDVSAHLEIKKVPTFVLNASTIDKTLFDQFDYDKRELQRLANAFKG